MECKGGDDWAHCQQRCTRPLWWRGSSAGRLCSPFTSLSTIPPSWAEGSDRSNSKLRYERPDWASFVGWLDIQSRCSFRCKWASWGGLGPLVLDSSVWRFSVISNWCLATERTLKTHWRDNISPLAWERLRHEELENIARERDVWNTLKSLLLAQPSPE